MHSSDSCFFLINSREYVWAVLGLAWIWLCLFFLLGNRGRLGLLSLLSAGRFLDLASRSVPISGCGSPSGRCIALHGTGSRNLQAAEQRRPDEHQPVRGHGGGGKALRHANGGVLRQPQSPS